MKHLTINFEEYLEKQHAKNYTGLDDEMSDDYDNWSANLDNQELIDYGQNYAELVKAKIYDNVIEELKSK